mmetsp:Transcript_143677/g.264890  ORF Transcript_143677/g.264890 Transcript_143677/m.264890 type:complete len:608 (+) Transcript_143677:2-1825(+)
MRRPSLVWAGVACSVHSFRVFNKPQQSGAFEKTFQPRELLNISLSAPSHTEVGQRNMEMFALLLTAFRAAAFNPLNPVACFERCPVVSSPGSCIRCSLPMMGKTENVMKRRNMKRDNPDIAPTSGVFGTDAITVQKGSNALLVGTLFKDDRYKTPDDWSLDDSLDELQRLCETAGLKVVGREHQALKAPSASTFIGAGKLQEIAQIVASTGVTTVVFDDEIAPRQSRNIQQALGGHVQVLDRTMLILFVFGQRARTREAQLQVAAAQIQYMMPRLSTYLTEGAGLDAKGGKAGGGGGMFLKGAGESQLEMDRRLYGKQLMQIEAAIADVQAQRDAHREKRRGKDLLPTVAIVGYTNAGKSTLLNKLVGKSEVYADDLLFATLDPTTRMISLDGGKRVLMSDTVGFIQKLPTKLVASFRATVDEITDAALIVHVVDASSPLATQQVHSVQGILEEFQADETPQILVLNKADAVDANINISKAVQEIDWANLQPGLTPRAVVTASAHDGRGLEELRMAIEEELLKSCNRVDCLLPFAEGALLAEVHKAGTIVLEDYVFDGVHLIAYVPFSLRNRLAKVARSFSDEMSRLDKADIDAASVADVDAASVVH